MHGDIEDSHIGEFGTGSVAGGIALAELTDEAGIGVQALFDKASPPGLPFS